MPEQPHPLPAPHEPETSRVFALLLKLGMDAEDAYAFVREVQNMAAANLIARIEAKLDAQDARLDAQLARFESRLEARAAKLEAGLETVRAGIKFLQWLVVAVGASVAVIVAVMQMLGRAAGVS